jgi:hypothetical protein
MEEKQIISLADFLVNLHFRNKDIIQGRPALVKYSQIAESPKSKNYCDINYSSDQRVSLKTKLLSFFRRPTAFSAMLLVHVDDRHDWIRLVRFVAKADGSVNAETIALSGKDVEKFNGFGYRYEHPEDAGDEHNFFHIQPIVTVSTGERIPGIPAWCSDKFPTFYMRADNSYELIIYALSSLCGWRQLELYQRTAREDCWLLKHLIAQGRAALQGAQPNQ